METIGVKELQMSESDEFGIVVLENVFSSLLCSGISDISISDSGTSTITR
jgi:hypothetical protein